MNNQQYLESIGVSNPETVQNCLEAMEKYGDNHWWEEGVELRTFAYYQINEPLMLCSKFSKLHEGTELLLGRPVWTHEFGINADELRKEAERAWTANEPLSQEEREASAVNGIESLLNWAETNGKQVMLIETK